MVATAHRHFSVRHTWLCGGIGRTLTASILIWERRDLVTCEKCLVLIAVAEANGITPDNYHEKLNFDNPVEIVTFRGALEWILRGSLEHPE